MRTPGFHRFVRSHAWHAGIVLALLATTSAAQIRGDPEVSPTGPDGLLVDHGTGPVPALLLQREQARALSDPNRTPSLAPPAAGGPQASTKGVFGTAFTWPIIAIHLALLPDARVFTYGTDETGSQQGSALKFGVWDPASAVFDLFDNTTLTQLFCATQTLTPSGRLLVIGGQTIVDKLAGNGSLDVNSFDPATNVLSAQAPMAFPRWYGSAVTLGNGDMVVLGGRILAPRPGAPETTSTFATTPELYRSGSGWTSLAGANSNAAYGLLAGQGANWSYPRAWLAPNGKVLSFGDDGVIHALDLAGSGTVAALPPRLKKRSVARFGAMYAPGKLILGRLGRNVQLVDLNGAAPVVTNAAPLSSERKYGSGTLLADGKVWVNGGSAGGNVLATAVYTSELWNPLTGAWTVTASAAKARLYHSNALLLADATVLTGGGGSPGPVSQFNAEIYYPPYLFNADGSWAERPQIAALSATTVGWGQTLTVWTGAAAPVSKVNLLRVGSATHALNNDQRFLTLPFVQSGSRLDATLPAAPNLAPPGYYMLFVLDEQGVPSHGKVIRIAPA
jgi:Domain of unknown function (DUF1929)